MRCIGLCHYYRGIKRIRSVTRRVHNLTGFLFRLHREMHRALSLLPRNKNNKGGHTQGSQLNRVSTKQRQIMSRSRVCLNRRVSTELSVFKKQRQIMSHSRVCLNRRVSTELSVALTVRHSTGSQQIKTLMSYSRSTTQQGVYKTFLFKV